MAAVALAWESQSTRSVGCSAVARQAARFTAVVVFPTPPFWFATAIIRDKSCLASENLAKPAQGCKMFHVEQQLRSENLCETLGILRMERMHHIRGCGTSFRLFHVEHGELDQVFASDVVLVCLAN